MATATTDNGTVNRLPGQQTSKPGKYRKFYGFARKAGGGRIPLNFVTDEGPVQVKLPFPSSFTPEAARTEAKEVGYSYTIPTEGIMIGEGVCGNGTGKMKGDVAVQALNVLMEKDEE